MNIKLVEELFSYARESIKNESFKPKEVPKPLTREQGVFVTIYLNDSLRGCIGFLKPRPLWQGVIEAARASAYNDPRFKPLSEEEYKDILIEISILSTPINTSYKEIKKGDGVILEQGNHSALFLPQVWLELTDKDEFLGHLCLKAGLSGDCYKKAFFKKFSVQAWKEEKDNSSIIIVPVIP